MIKNILLIILITSTNNNFNIQLEKKSKQKIKIGYLKKVEGIKFQQIDLHSKVLLDNKLKMLFPRNFKLMDTEMLNLKYPVQSKQPTLVYTDREGEINIAFNYTNSNIKVDDLSKIKASMINQFEQISTISLIDSDLKNINGNQFFIVKFYSQAIDTEVYNLMFGTELDGRLLIGTLNCTVTHLPEWQPIADKIINSIEVL